MSGQVFQVHPQNPRCFLYQGRPFKIITSAEHYGAVQNAEFDYDVYLQELRRTGENMTRVFCFSRELYPSECGELDTLGPRPEALVSPWQRVPGHGRAGDGLDKFDLEQWNPEFFVRLRDFVIRCGRQGVVCEIVLFGNPYDRQRWDLFPCSGVSNISGVGVNIDEPREFMTLKHPTLVRLQERFVRKMAQELNDCDNVYYEICNEPSFWGQATEERERQIVAWHGHLARFLRSVGRDLPKQHLIAANAHFEINVPAEPGEPDTRLQDLYYFENPDIDIVNYHYISRRAQAKGLLFVRLASHTNPGNTRAGVIWRFLRERDGFRKPIVFDETFSGVVYGAPEQYAINRAEAWETVLSGGAGYDNLDWSFTVADETGSGKVPIADGRRLDGRCLRDWLALLRQLLAQYDLAALVAARDLVPQGIPGHGYAASGDGRGRYILYMVDQRVYEVDASPSHAVTVALHLPPGTYSARTFNPRTGAVASAGTVDADKPALTVEFSEDVAVLLEHMS